jgi:PIN domain nuclease of toxin-antitoxin system
MTLVVATTLTAGLVPMSRSLWVPGAGGESARRIRHTADLDAAIANQRFTCLPISVRHGQVAAASPGPDRDSFDRVPIARARLKNLVLVSNGRPFEVYGVGPLW